jgi:hypothetical protein
MSAYIVREALITLPLLGTGLSAAEIAADPKLSEPCGRRWRRFRDRATHMASL